MSDLIYQENNRLHEKVKHFEALWGYTRKAAEDAIKEIHTAYEQAVKDSKGEELEPIWGIMKDRAKELNTHLEFLEEQIG